MRRPMTEKQIEAIDVLRDELPSLLEMHSPSSTRADYECAFCRGRPATNDGEIPHATDCLGLKLQEILPDLFIRLQRLATEEREMPDKGD